MAATNYDFISAFYEIIKRYDYFEEKIRMGSFGKFEPNELFVYINHKDKSFFFDFDNNTAKGFSKIILASFFRDIRNGIGLGYLDNVYLTIESELSGIIAKELDARLNYEYYAQAKDAFNNFISNGYVKDKCEPIMQLQTVPPEEKELNACIERTESILNRKINFDNL